MALLPRGHNRRGELEDGEGGGAFGLVVDRDEGVTVSCRGLAGEGGEGFPAGGVFLHELMKREIVGLGLFVAAASRSSSLSNTLLTIVSCGDLTI